jgi:hypothetical protein
VLITGNKPIQIRRAQQTQQSHLETNKLDATLLNQPMLVMLARSLQTYDEENLTKSCKAADLRASTQDANYKSILTYSQLTA